ncbi:MAG: 50S ribosomal protein L29 [Candidatus Micrarchaeota archaeon]|nr:50S ribosomal protein L29 [Candidatus Micrarchaeota archaeon]
MAIIKKSKLREFSDAELSKKLIELQKELNAERGLLASGGRTSNPGKIRQLKITIARILTIMHERKLGIKRKNAEGEASAKKEVKAVA